MKSNTNSLRMNFLISICSVYFLMNSCSLIGFGIGSAVDKKKPLAMNIDLAHIDTLELEKRVEVIQFNGDTVKGRYNGLIALHGEDYLVQYNRIKEKLSNQVKLPNLYDTLLIAYNKNKPLRKIGLFNGFELGALWCQYAYGENFFSICLDSIINISINNKYDIDSIQINNYLSEQTFPNFLHLKIDVKKGSLMNIELASVKRILIIDKRNRKFIGLGVGLALDIIISLIIIDQSFDPELSMSF